MQFKAYSSGYNLTMLLVLLKCPNREIWFFFSGGWNWGRLAARVFRGEFDVFNVSPIQTLTSDVALCSIVEKLKASSSFFFYMLFTVLIFTRTFLCLSSPSVQTCCKHTPLQSELYSATVNLKVFFSFI